MALFGFVYLTMDRRQFPPVTSPILGIRCKLLANRLAMKQKSIVEKQGTETYCGGSTDPCRMHTIVAAIYAGAIIKEI